MANPDRDTVYTDDGAKRTVYTRNNNSTGWFVGIVVALALLAIAYLVFSANSQPSSTTINNNPAATTTTPLAPADTGASIAPMVSAPIAPDAASTATPAAPGATATSAPVTTTSTAPSVAPSAPATSAAQ